MQEARRRLISLIIRHLWANFMKLIYYASSTKELFSETKTEKKDKKTRILKNAALKIICFSF